MSKDGKKNKWSSGPKNWSSGSKNKGFSKPKNKYVKRAQFKPPDKRGRIIIRNIPYKATEDTIRSHFAEFGEIREVNLLKRPDGNPVGCGFVQYNNEENASEAIKKRSGKELMGRKITVDWAMQQAFYNESRLDQPQAEEEEAEEEEPPYEMEQTVDLEDDTNNYESEDKHETEVKEEDEGFEIVPSTNPAKIKARKEKRKRNDLLKKQKKGRIIVRNLPFKVTEDSLRQHFSEYGSLSEVTILRRPDGRLVGCGFIQFESIKNASKAILECSGKPLLGRPIVLDWAVAKNAYQAKISPPAIKIKEEPEDDYKYDKKPTLDDSNATDPDTDIKSESDSEEEDTKDFKEEDSDFKEEKFDDDDDNDDFKEPEAKRPRVISNDVSEGKTVFIKNVPFSANNVELKSCMAQFGPVMYALICVDRMTEHSKGSAFVKFKNVESAKKCLAAGTELTLNGQVLDPHPALNRDQVGSKAAAKDVKVAKDSRNLFLVKEGVILAGSPAAAGLSVTDMSKRLQLEQWKSQMLRNLNMFVARDRLAVHNIPPSFDDAKLRALFQKETGPNAVITEARVMRDKKNFDANGVGESKGTGFVKFTTHEDALQALRSINNNPNIFSKTKRPIVAFAIENRAIHKVRKQRELKSKAKNPTSSSYAGPISSSVPGPSSVPGKNKKFAKAESRRERRAKERPTTAPQAEDFSGLSAAPGNTRLRPKHKLKAQAALHTETVRKNKVKAKAQQRFAAQRLVQEKPIKQAKQKKGKGKQLNDDGTFSKLVNNYVSKIAASTEGKKKWYEGN